MQYVLSYTPYLKNQQFYISDKNQYQSKLLDFVLDRLIKKIPFKDSYEYISSSAIFAISNDQIT
jgi:hypothetical protein